MYLAHELVEFALSEFRRGIEGLTDEEARARMGKADGTQMNAVSWTVGHIAEHWLSVAKQAGQEVFSTQARQYAYGATDPTPPPLDDTLRLLDSAQASTAWVATADDRLMSTPAEGRQESVGTILMRAVLHTWFHAGEINAVRQMLGHPEIVFVGPMANRLEWRSG